MIQATQAIGHRLQLYLAVEKAAPRAGVNDPARDPCKLLRGARDRLR